MPEVREGYVDKIVFRNEENGYTVFSLVQNTGELTCVGTFSFIGVGEYMRVTGSESTHMIYGSQFVVHDYEYVERADERAVEKYLASGAIKGVGAVLAARIVEKFGADSFRILEEEPERLTQVSGISERIAKSICEQFSQKRELRSAMLFLQRYGISVNFAVKIYQQYGTQMYEVIKQNPYRLAEDIRGVGFRMADEIAARVGISTDSDYRIRAALLYLLQQGVNNGHVYLPQEVLLGQLQQLLRIEEEQATHMLEELAMEHRVVIKDRGAVRRDDTDADTDAVCRCVYSASYYFMELNTARMLADLSITYDIRPADIEKRIARLEEASQLCLDEMQRKAVFEAARRGLLVLTGGPGTGKTTTINTMLRFFEAEGMEIMLAAPTGRAAKRMQETTGYEAKTIHRLLEITKGIGEDENSAFLFMRNEGNPLETDVLIIDELSMVDLSLMHALLKAVTVGTRVILVGDANQLPSVGAGNVLRDIIESDCFPVVRLSKIFRQAQESDIVVNAHKINAGEQISLQNKSKDFLFMNRAQVRDIQGVLVALVRDKLPSYVNAKPYDIQVLTPMRKGELGVERLNQILQQYLNPPDVNKAEKELHGGLLREGDKVMQVKNNYQLTWEIRNKYGIMQQNGLGVFNGDIGVIRRIAPFSEQIVVEFDEGRQVEYQFAQADELELAYAVTVHKSQGSEYPAVVLPLLKGPPQLMHRNILYTAVTRAKQCVTIVGDPELVRHMINNAGELRRYSGLQEQLRELLA